MLKWLMVLLISFMLNSSNEIPNRGEKEINYIELGKVEGNRIIVDHNIDLKDRALKLPKGMILCFKKGLLKNGTVVGNETKIEAKGTVFDNVSIRGTWNVSQISTKMFANLGRENSLKDIFALTNPNCSNTVVIEEGNYNVRSEKDADACLSVCSNTNLILNGTIYLTANNYKHYYILDLKGQNIKISGKGSIIGDRRKHTGKEGEWGMGINLRGAVNTTIYGIRINDCWGDCIYVGGNSKNILIENCKLERGRRQGISITKANGVIIKNCTITNIRGTKPGYAIDVEPNSQDSVCNILIDNTKVKNCEGGILVKRKQPKPQSHTPFIGDIVIQNCSVSDVAKYPIRIKRCESARIEKNLFIVQNNNATISILDVDGVVVSNNTIYIKDAGRINNIINNVKKVYKAKEDPISIVQTKRVSQSNNNIKYLK